MEFGINIKVIRKIMHDFGDRIKLDNTIATNLEFDTVGIPEADEESDHYRYLKNEGFLVYTESNEAMTKGAIMATLTEKGQCLRDKIMNNASDKEICKILNS